MITVYDHNGTEIVIPTKFEVCPRCEGEGKHINPSIDGNGITSNEMHELGPDFEEDYMNGVYDITCTECKGKRVAKTADFDKMTAYEIDRYKEAVEWEANYAAERAHEIRMGY